MSSKMVALLPLAAGSGLISMALLNLPLFSAGAFVLEWVGALLAFYGLTYLIGAKTVLPIAGAVLVTSSLADAALIGRLNLTDWVIVNYMVFMHATLGSVAGHVIRAGLRLGYG
jgi:hypothetical protein